jgi:hypothetical protein
MHRDIIANMDREGGYDMVRIGIPILILLGAASLPGSPSSSATRTPKWAKVIKATGARIG